MVGVTLRPILPAQLYAEWGWVRSGLLHCIEKTQERHLPEDVYHAIRAGGSFLFAIEYRGDDVGFVVLQQHADPDGGALFIWALWIEPGFGVVIENDFVSALEDKARSIGLGRLRMHSPRKGWNRRRFFRPVSVIYEREVV